MSTKINFQVAGSSAFDEPAPRGQRARTNPSAQNEASTCNKKKINHVKETLSGEERYNCRTSLSEEGSGLSSADSSSRPQTTTTCGPTSVPESLAEPVSRSRSGSITRLSRTSTTGTPVTPRQQRSRSSSRVGSSLASGSEPGSPATWAGATGGWESPALALPRSPVLNVVNGNSVLSVPVALGFRQGAVKTREYIATDRYYLDMD